MDNLLLLCPTCHSKITKKDILIDEVLKAKQNNSKTDSVIQFISTTIDTENYAWEPYENIPNAFKNSQA